MGYKYEMKNSERTVRKSKEFKEIVLWDITAFIQDSLPNKRPISITIEQD